MEKWGRLLKHARGFEWWLPDGRYVRLSALGYLWECMVWTDGRREPIYNGSEYWPDLPSILDELEGRGLLPDE